MFYKVICIDDDPIALMLSKLVISKSKIKNEVITFTNGKDAASYLGESEVIENGKNSKESLLIFLDLNMPIMDGWEFLKQFSQNLFNQYNNTQIILLTSSIDPLDILKSKYFSFVLDFLPKPLTNDALDNILTKI